MISERLWAESKRRSRSTAEALVQKAQGKRHERHCRPLGLNLPVIELRLRLTDIPHRTQEVRVYAVTDRAVREPSFSQRQTSLSDLLPAAFARAGYAAAFFAFTAAHRFLTAAAIAALPAALIFLRLLSLADSACGGSELFLIPA